MMQQKLKTVNIFVFTVLLATTISFGKNLSTEINDKQLPDRIFIRIHVNETKPPNLPVQVGVSVLKSTFEPIACMVFGADGRIAKFDKNIEWKNLEDIPPIKTGEYSRWVEITDIIYKKYPYKGGWVPFDNSYGQKTFVFVFYSPAMNAIKPLDTGNLESVTASIDFATVPDEKAIIKTVKYASENGCVPVYIRKPSERLADYANQIRSLYDYAVDRYELLKNIGMKEQPLPKRILTSLRIQNGYWYPIYDSKTMAVEVKIARLLGARSILWKLRNVDGIDKTTFPEHTPFFWEDSRPDWIDPNPWTENLSEKVKNKIGTQIAQSIKHWGLAEDDKILFKMGDEWRIMDTQTVLRQPGGLAAFREWLQKRGTVPEQIGVISIDDALPIDKSEVKGDKTARLYWLSVWFRQEATIDWWKRYIDAMRNVFGGRLIATTETYMGPFAETPNVFLLSRSGGFDIDSHEYAQRLWVPPHAALLKGAIYRSAAKFGKSKPGILWCSYRGLGEGAKGIMELDGTTALINGMEHIYLYCYGPKWSGWGQMDDENIEIYAEAGKIMQRTARVEDYILDGESPLKNPQAAMLLSQSTELWAGGAENDSEKDGTLCERQMLAASLAWNQIPFDVICEFDVEKLLNNYRVLYITDANLSSDAQKAVEKWVRNGGTLFSIAGSAERNEINQSESLIEKLMSAGDKIIVETPANTPNYKETRQLYDIPILDTAIWLDGSKHFQFKVFARKEKYEIKSGKILSKYMDGRTASVQFNCGKGKVIRIGTALGTVMARTMVPRFTSPIVDNYHKFDDNICKIYALPFEQDASLVRPLRISKNGVDATFYEKDNGAIILLADYESPEKNKIDIEVSFAKKYTSCRNDAGVELPIVHEDGKTIVRDVELGTSEVLTFK